MTEAERDKAMLMARRMAELEDGCCVTAGRVFALAKMFPVPDTTGMTPAQAEVTLENWRVTVRAYVAWADSNPVPLASPFAPAAATPSAPPEVPVS
jgi:hypothetical protein